MLDRRGAIAGLMTATVAGAEVAAGAQGRGTAARPGQLASGAFRIVLDPATGALDAIVDPRDPAGMSWISGSANAPWQPAGARWGLGYADLGADQLHRGRWDRPVDVTEGTGGTIVTYRVGPLEVRVERRLVGDALNERYTFRNTGTAPIPMRGRGQASLAIYVPCNDHYTSTADVLEHRAHAHLWTGGAASWIAMRRMGGRGPHLGLVLTEGALDGYSIEGRDQVTLSNTRGVMLVHPVIGELAPGGSASIAWTLFWHADWDDFFAQAGRRSPQMVRIDASDWTGVAGESARLTFGGDLGPDAALTVGKTAVPLRRAGDRWTATLPAGAPGERVATLTYRGRTTRAVLNTVPALRDLAAARVRFITTRQQWSASGDSWNGAYITYDNEAEAPARWERSSDRNAARERVGMGVLVAIWLRGAGRGGVDVRRSLDRYYAFVNAQVQRPDGYVSNGPGRSESKRLYNWPWVMQLHLAVAALGTDPAPLRRFVTTLDSYYREGGIDHYPINLPVSDGLAALKAAGMTAEHDRVRALFVAHGQRIAQRGVNYPPFEVNFEQSIVAPAAMVLLDLHRATGERRWLDAARPHVALLDLFEGRQPDHHLNGVAIRHWDGYWFGKARMWGDTFPHYWSSLNGLVWSMFAAATNDPQWRQRARTTLRNNLGLFTPDGRGSAAFLYPTTVDGRPAHFADPYANDQDWALVHALLSEERYPSIISASAPGDVG